LLSCLNQANIESLPFSPVPESSSESSSFQGWRARWHWPCIAFRGARFRISTQGGAACLTGPKLIGRLGAMQVLGISG